MSAEAPGQGAPKQDAAVVVGRGVMFIGFAKVYFMLSGFVQRLLLTYLLPPADLGDFAIANSAISTLNNTVVQGTIQGVSKFTAEDDARAGAVQRAGVRLQAAFGAAVALAFFVAAPWIAAIWKAPQCVPYFRIVAVIPLLYSVYSVFVGSANGLRRFRTQASFDVGFSTMKTVLLLCLALLWKVTGAFIGFAAAAAVILVIAARVMRLPASAEPFPVRRIIGYMGAVVLYAGLINLALNYDVLLMRYFALSARGMDPGAAAAAAGLYEALRNFALLPYQVLLVVTFVIFPLVSQATFAADREATRAYVSQTMRYALILAGLMGIVLAARPSALFSIINARYRDSAPALPYLAAGECCLALLAVACAILNAAGRAGTALALIGTTLVVGSTGMAILVPRAAAGTPLLIATATATAIGMAAGLVAAVVVLRARFSAGPPPATVARVALAMAAAVVAARVVPGQGRVVGFAVIALAGIAYAAVLIVTREFGPDDRAKFAKVFRRR